MFVRRFALLLAVTAAAGLTACGGDKAAPSNIPAIAAATPTASPSRSASATPSTTASATVIPTVMVGTVTGRQVLVDQDGRSLYVFLNDRSNVSTCVDECAVTWPPLGGEAKAGQGAAAANLGTITRPDGRSQTTYFQKPLYYFHTDMKPGDANGQGISKVWYLVDAKGQPVK
jgi:predicted lipoprotein with Yx(FWY)xxD motif